MSILLDASLTAREAESLARRVAERLIRAGTRRNAVARSRKIAVRAFEIIADAEARLATAAIHRKCEELDLLRDVALAFGAEFRGVVWHAAAGLLMQLDEEQPPAAEYGA